MDSKAIANQKVFVTLASVLELQNEIERLASSSIENTRFMAKGLYRAATALGLPVAVSDVTYKVVR